MGVDEGIPDGFEGDTDMVEPADFQTELEEYGVGWTEGADDDCSEGEPSWWP